MNCENRGEGGGALTNEQKNEAFLLEKSAENAAHLCSSDSSDAL